MVTLAFGCQDDVPPSSTTNADASVGVDMSASVDMSATDQRDMRVEQNPDDMKQDPVVDSVEPLDEPAIYIGLGADLPDGVHERVPALFRQVATRPVVVTEKSIRSVAEGSLVVVLGDHPDANALIPDAELDELGPEGVIVRDGVIEQTTMLAARGNPMLDAPSDSTLAGANIGAGFAAYEAMQQLGFAFLHPLSPSSPGALPQTAPEVDYSASPRWRIRGLQLHTMHPLELTDLLNGFDETGGYEDRQAWEEMLPEWDTYLEWMLANKQNRVQWVLLWAEPWSNFADGDERIDRLATLVEHAHDFGVMAGVDVPIALHQQHAWRMVRREGELDDELAQIRARVDYLMRAKFDYFATESGSSEFTAPDGAKMLAWMDELAKHLDKAHNQRRAFMKIHASTGQTVDGYTDPETGEPLNFNFLPTYADPRLGIQPHTVQHYALDDPAPTYGNTDFAYMREYLQEEVGRREVVWHPETAYWVSFDVDIPLFLPVYAERRFHDLRLIARDERSRFTGRGEHVGEPMDGQIIFSSGWEWGYWFNDVISARASWDIHEDTLLEERALEDAFERALAPMGDAARPMAEALVRQSREQHKLLILGDYGNGIPTSYERRTGMAYIQGFDAWDDVADAAELLPMVPHFAHQPDKLGLVEMRNPLHAAPNYTARVKPLLAEMERAFGAHASELDAMRDRVAPQGRELFEELVASSRMTALRAKQIHGLYDYVDKLGEDNPTARIARLQQARDALDEATKIVQAREQSYRVPAERIAGWRKGPTAYEFGYLWTARSLYFWWRDEGKAVDAPSSPCYLNIINGLTVGFGEGLWSGFGDIGRQITENVWGISGLTKCLGAPDIEPMFPQEDLRSRP